MNRPVTRWSRVAVVSVLAAAVVGVFVLAFTWPSVTSTVHAVPVVVTGEGAAAEALAQQLDTVASATFDVSRASSRDDAVTLIESRAVLGAVVADESVPEVLTASANGVAASQVFTQLAAQLQGVFAQQLEAQGVAADAVPTIEVTDVVPLAATDARGSGLTALAFPLVIGGMIGGIAVSLLVAGVWRRLVGVLAYGVVVGAVVVAIGQGWFGILQGNPVLNGLAVGAAVVSISAFIVGMTSLIGPPGIAVGAVLAMLVGNPISGAAQPVQFLPAPWGAVGQFLPPGAGATLLRDLSYFPAAPTWAAWLVLAAWIAVGVLLMAFGHFRRRAVLPRHDGLERPAGRASAPTA